MTDKKKIEQLKALLREHVAELDAGKHGCGKCDLCKRTAAALEDG